MKQARFIEQNEAFWKNAEELIKVRKQLDSSLPDIYQRLSHHLSVAQTRDYSHSLILYLESLVFQYHKVLFEKNRKIIENIWHFFRHEFPLSVRDHARLVSVSALLFFVPLIGLPILIHFYHDALYYFLTSSTMSSIEEMYDPANTVLGRERGDDSNWMMFGYYIYNNTGIGFRTFATGLLLGIGSAFFILYNGIFIGAIIGYIISLGYTETFFSFTSGHSSFELIAIVLSGASGLCLGHSILKPGNVTRLHSLQLAAKKVMPVMLGAMTFFFIAAGIEAFWSPGRSVPFNIKVTIGITLWLLIFLYLLFAGDRTAGRATNES